MSSCFPWLERGAAAARGAGTLALGQGDSFFFFLAKASSLPPCVPAGRGGGVVGGRSPRCPPPSDPRWALSKEPSPGTRSLSRQIPPGGARRILCTSAPPHLSGKPRLG